MPVHSRDPHVDTHTSVPFAGGSTVQGIVQKQETSSLPFHALPKSIVTPVNVRELSHLLAAHPNPEIVEFLISGFTFGFDLKFNGSVHPGIQGNLRSASKYEAAVTSAIRKEITRGHFAGPHQQPPIPHLHCSPLGAVPKPDGSVRLILDLSSPHNGFSVNDDIDKNECSVKYSHFDEAFDMVRELGAGSYMAWPK